mgnify:CR=1 FL=1
MTKRILLSTASLWLFILSAGLITGGSIFEGVVLTPLWSHALPDSVRHWPYGTIQSKFFAVVTPLYALLSLALLISVSIRILNVDNVSSSTPMTCGAHRIE